MTKLTEEGARILARYNKEVEAEFPLVQPDFCDTHCTWRDHHPDCERAEPVQEPDVPFPGMQEEFEAYYSQSFIDRDWRREAGVWAASWKAATRYTAPPDQTAEIERLKGLCERMKQEAQIHAQEARTANTTIAEIYRCVSGSTGEPGNWHGAEPVRNRIATLEAALREVLATRNEEARAISAYENAKENFTNSVEESKRYVKAVTAASEAEKNARKALGEE